MSYILIVEDDTAIAKLLSLNLTYNNYAYKWANSVESAVELINNEIPMLILLDWMLPGRDGISLLQQLKDQSVTKDIPIIILTAKTQEQHRIKGLTDGADDYIMKPFSVQELMLRIKNILKRTNPEINDNIHIKGLNLNASNKSVTYKDNSITLSNLEFKLFIYLLQHPNVVCSRERLLNKIWGYNNYVEERTVDASIKRLRKQLTLLGLTALITTIHGVGYKINLVNID